MIATLLWGLGLVLVIEGLVWALWPRGAEQALAALSQLPLDQRRLIGLGVLAAGVMVVWVATAVG
jgi:uncharacterized protein